MNKCTTCNSDTIGEYCHNCGQKTNLERINWNYIKHEIVHLLHFEKGFFYTIQELLLRPGMTVKVFLTKNRNRIVKPIIFIILTSLIYTLINNYFHIDEQYIQSEMGKRPGIDMMMNWVREHYGYSNIMMSTLIAFFIKILFKNYKLNIYEILILLCYVMGMSMLILTIVGLIQGLFKLDLYFIGFLLATIYTIFAITDFFDKRKFVNYVKAFSGYILGSITFYFLLGLIAVIYDRLIK